MIRTEYLRFLQTLTDITISDDVRKIANLVLNHLDTLIPLSSAQGQRVKRIVELAQLQWETLVPIIQPVLEQEIQPDAAITQLKSIKVGPFRGFSRQEEFDLNSRIVLIYGPNGSGKSSFCEALEYGLLGNVVEADNNRFRNQDDYLKNAHSNTFASPGLVGKDEQDNDIPIIANEAEYRFCFVEKNRIDSFSRIAAQAPAKQTELISTLFGLDSFNEFVRNFTNEIDERYIDLEGIKAKELETKRQSLTGFTQQLQSIPGELEQLGREEQALAHQYREGITFAQMLTELNGDSNNPGLIQSLETQLQEQMSAKSNLTMATLQELKRLISTTLTNLNAKQQELASSSQEVSFKQLYEAVIQVQQGSQDYCPACNTPLADVSVNPYVRANSELQRLQHLATLQQTIAELEQTLNEHLISLSQTLKICCTHFPVENMLNNYQLVVHTQASIEWWNSLQVPLQDGLTPLQHLQDQVNNLEEADQEIDRATEQRAAKNTELQRCREFLQQITSLQARRQSASGVQSRALQAISTFDAENAQLIIDASAEIEDVARNRTIASAYADFVARLNVYKNNLPSQLVADMGETVVSLYNAFNRNDRESELLSSVHLPLTQNQRLDISFQSEPETFFDALHVLSEGHIRCIGLAILMAKNLRENSPVLIFDDPVNAIDDDHRESIRKTLFEDTFFNEKQIILTCHGEEFFKDIQNLLSAEQAALSKAFTFLPRLDEQHIRVDFNPAPRNYIISARTHIENGEIRYALAKSRQALESIAKNKLWQYVSRHGDGNLSIKLRAANAPIELRNLSEQLRSKISRGDFADQHKNSVLEPIDSLLGMNGSSREWRYLNKGTHEETDRMEFDRQTVQQIVNYLEQIDDALG